MDIGAGRKKNFSGVAQRIRVIHAIDELVTVSGFEYGADVLTSWREQGHRILNNAIAMAESAGVQPA